MKPVDYIHELSKTSELSFKKAIIRQAATSGCIEFFEGFQLAYSKRRIFDIKSIPIIEGNFTEEELKEESNEFTWSDFILLVNRIESKKLTGKNAQTALRAIAEIACIEDWNDFYRPILRKNMKCGTTASMINKVLKEMGGEALKYLIPIWKVQTAITSTKKLNQFKGKKLVDSKIDGTRCIAILDKELEVVHLFQKNGKEITKFPSINKDLKKLINEIPVSIVLDGSMTNKNTYELFDILPLVDFENGRYDMTQLGRQDALVELAPFFQEHCQNISIIPKLIVDLDTDEGKENLKEFHKELLEQGYNIMIKDVNALYECKRSDNWIKIE